MHPPRGRERRGRAGRPTRRRSSVEAPLLFGHISNQRFNLYYVGAFVMTIGLFLFVRSASVMLLVAVINGFFTLGQFSWMPVYLPELFPTAVRGTAISLVQCVS